jgi:uncharacterized phage protein (TIGR02220 family)
MPKKMKHVDIKLKIVECNADTNQVILQTNSATFTLKSKKLVEFLATATFVKETKSRVNHAKNEVATEILEYLNQKGDRKFPANSTNLSFISARLADGEKPELLRQIIDIKVWAWKNDYNMKKFIRPETLFGTKKFQSYKQEVMDVHTNPEQFKKHVKEKEDERNSKDRDNLDEFISPFKR